MLINGLFASLESWQGALPYLDGFHLLRYDGRGQGESEKPAGPYTLDDHVGDLARLLDDLDWPVTALAGISNGGCVALAFARRYPDRVYAVAAADCYATVTPLLRLKMKSWLLAHEAGGPTHRFDIATPWIWSEATVSEHGAVIDGYRAKAAEHPERAVRGLMEGAMAFEIPLAGMATPVLLLVGEEDVLTPPSMMAAMHRALPDSRLRVVEGGHASLLEHPEHFGSVIAPFLREHADVG